MIHFLPSAPSDLIEAFTTMDIKKQSNEVVLDLFKKTLEHVDDIAFIDKEKFITAVKEKTKNNPQLQKLAVKILIEADSEYDRNEIEQKIDALPDDPLLIKNYKTAYKLLKNDPYISNLDYLELCSSPMVGQVKVIYNSMPLIHQNAQLALQIHKVIKNFSPKQLTTFFNTILKMELLERTTFLEFVSKLDPSEIEIVCFLRPQVITTLMARGETFSSAFFNNAKVAITGIRNPRQSESLVEELHWWTFRNRAHNVLLKENVGELVKDISNYSLRRNIIISLLSITNEERDRFLELSQSLAAQSGYTLENLSCIINALKNIPKEHREEVAKICVPLITITAPEELASTFTIFNLCPPEKITELLSLAEITAEHDIPINIDVLKALLKIPSEQVKEVAALVEQCTELPNERAEIFYSISTIENKDERVQILNQLLRIVKANLKTDFILEASNVLKILKFVPSENRESAISSVAKTEHGQIEWGLTIFGCFAEHFHERLAKVSDPTSFKKVLAGDTELRKEFIKNIHRVIQQVETEDLEILIQFLDGSELWLPSFAEQFVKRDANTLTNVVDKGLNDEIIRYIKTDEGFKQLCKVKDIYYSDFEFLESIFTAEELKVIELAGKNVDLKNVKNVASQEVYNYLSSGNLLLTANRLAPKRDSAPLSEEARQEIHRVLSSRNPLTKRRWKEISYTQEMIEKIRPDFDKVMYRVKVGAIQKNDTQISIEGKTITLYEEELKALFLYTSQNYLLINGVLDNDETSLDLWCRNKFSKGTAELSDKEKLEMEDAIQALDKIFDLLSSIINKMPIEIRPLYRGDAIATKELAKRQIGNVFTTSKFFSCTIQPAISEVFAKTSAIDYMEDTKEEYKPVIYVIDSKSSHNISSLSQSEGEDERIYLPNQSFQIQEIDETTQPGLAIIYLKEVDTED